MLWSAILALGSLMLIGHVASIPWFLALVPLVLLAIWNACLLVRQRQYQAAWDGLLEKSGDGKSSGSGKAAVAVVSARELGVRDVPATLGALVAPSVLVFHGLLLGAVVTGGVVHELNPHGPAHGKSELASAACGCGGGDSRVAGAKGEGSGCGCGGGGSAGANVATRSTPPVTRPPTTPPRNFNNAVNRPSQGPPNAAYPTRPVPGLPGAQARTPAQPGTMAPGGTPSLQPPGPQPVGPGVNPAVGPVPGPAQVPPTGPSASPPTPSPAGPAAAPLPVAPVPKAPVTSPQTPTTSARPS